MGGGANPPPIPIRNSVKPSQVQSEDEDVDTFLSTLPIPQSSSNGVFDLTEFVERGVFVGGGSFGEVYKGKWVEKKIPSSRQLAKLPPLAVKVFRIPPIGNESTRMKRRKQLERELKVWDRLRHKNILRLIGLVSLDSNLGQYSLISLWMPHGTVMSYVRRHPEAPKMPIALGIARGLLYLHYNDPKVIHGDLKPDNVLIDDRGNPCLCDFGLSRMMEDSTIWDTSATHASGTLRWQAPELIVGHVATVTLAGDVYAYAITCYEIMTGLMPFADYPNDAAVIIAVSQNQARPPKPLNFRLVPGLWELWEACWGPDPQARPPMRSVLTTMEKLTGVVSDIQRKPSAAPLRQTSNTTSSPQKIISGSFDETVKIWDVESGKDVYTLKHNGSIKDVKMSPDASFIATCSSGSQDVFIWSVESGEKLNIRLEHDYYPRAVAWSPDGRFLVTAQGGNNDIQVWHTDTWEKSHTMVQKDNADLGIDISPDSSRILCCGCDQKLYVWDAQNGNRLGELDEDYEYRQFIAGKFSPDGTKIATGSVDGKVELYDVKTLDKIWSCDWEKGAHFTGVRCIAWTPDSSRFVSTCSGNRLRVWEPASAKVVLSVDNVPRFSSIAVSPDGCAIICGTYYVDEGIEIRSLQTGELIRSLRSHEGHITSVVCTPVMAGPRVSPYLKS